VSPDIKFDVIKMKCIVQSLVILTLAIASQGSGASEMPESILGEYRLKQPICFYTSVGSGVDCEGFAYDTIAIERKSKTTAYVGVTLMFQNAERCHFHGVGRWDGKVLNASAPSDYGEQMCRLKISFQNDHAKVLEANEACNQGFCGYHGSLGTTRSLPRSKRDSR